MERVLCPAKLFFMQYEIPPNFRLHKNDPLWMRTRTKRRKMLFYFVFPIKV